MKRRIAIIGASYLQLPLVRKAQEMGLEVHCFAWQDGAVCQTVADRFYPISITEKEEILRVCRQVGVHAVTTIASDLAVPTVNYVAAQLGLTGNDDRYSAMVTNKLLMRRAFAEHGVPSPAFALVRVTDEGVVASDLAQAEALPLPVIVKPTDRSGSRGVERVTERRRLEGAIARAAAESFGRETIVEEYVEGSEVSVESISWQGRHHVLQITDKVTTGAPHFVELEHHQPSLLPPGIQADIRTLVPHVLDALHIAYGASHTEIKITPDGRLFVVETGARMGGDFIGSDLVALSTGYDYLRGVIEVALGTFSEPVTGEHHYAGVYFLSAETAWLKPIIANAVKGTDGVVAAEMTSNELRQTESSADRSGYLIYQNDNGRLQLR